MSGNALIFGSIGTLVETSDLQRRAFNVAFEEAGLDWCWEPQEYRELLKKPGGRDRIADYAAERGLSVEADRLHRRKTQLFCDAIQDEGLDLRPGVRQTIDAACGEGWLLGFATTTTRENIDAVFSALGEQLKRSEFDVITDGDVVARPKPAPDVYHVILQNLGTSSEHCVAVEDTPVSLKAAIDANLKTIAFPGRYADHGRFVGAMTIVEELRFDAFAAAV
jgi:HAD superfamily hydrolase (TIGR01509 family)